MYKSKASPRWSPLGQKKKTEHLIWVYADYRLLPGITSESPQRCSTGTAYCGHNETSSAQWKCPTGAIVVVMVSFKILKSANQNLLGISDSFRSEGGQSM